MINPSLEARNEARRAVASQNRRPLGCIPFLRSDCTTVSPAVFRAVKISSNDVRPIPWAQARAIVAGLRNAGLLTPAGHLSSLVGADAALRSVRMGKPESGLSSVQLEYAKAVAIQLCGTERQRGLIAHVEKSTHDLRDLTREASKIEQPQGGCWGAF